MDKYREVIKDYFKTKDKVEPTVTEIINKKESIKDINMNTDIPAGIDIIEKAFIEEKINILKKKEKYLEDKTKIEAAITDLKERKLLKQHVVMAQFLKIHGISPEVLSHEIALASEVQEYQYDRKIRSQDGFSYQEEEMLLQQLKSKFTEDLQHCKCRICNLLKLSTLVFKYAVDYNIWYSTLWDIDDKVDSAWLEGFEMRHSSELSQMSEKNCLLE